MGIRFRKLMIRLNGVYLLGYLVVIFIVIGLLCLSSVRVIKPNVNEEVLVKTSEAANREEFMIDGVRCQKWENGMAPLDTFVCRFGMIQYIGLENVGGINFGIGYKFEHLIVNITEETLNDVNLDIGRCVYAMGYVNEKDRSYEMEALRIGECP